MLNISSHIKKLLLKHNCVIIPDLGGFVTQYMPAICSPEKQQLLPPSRFVGFNSQLTYNDGLLIESLMKTNDSSYPETEKQLKLEVEALKRHIAEEGSYEFPGIGRIVLNVVGKYQFEPVESGLVSPNFYGLDYVSIRSFNRRQDLSLKHFDIPVSPKINESPRSYTFKINRDLVNYVSAAVIAIIFYFAWSTPSIYQQRDSLVAASFMSNAASKISTPSESPVVAQTLTPNLELKPSVSANEQAEQHEEISKSPVICYTIVVASAISKKNAQNFVAELEKSGVSDVFVHQSKSMRRVLKGKYPSEGAAYTALRSLRNHDGFRDAWVMKIKL